MVLKGLLIAFAIAAAPAAAQAPDPVVPPPAPPSISLWPNGAPGSEARRNEAEAARDYWVMNVHNPSLTVFPADPHHRNGTAMIVIPGGAHKFLVYTTEGTAVAQPLNRMGITTFVLKYRLAKSDGSPYSVERDEMRDVRRAVRWVRAHAADYGIDPRRIGVMGFSAGGELVNLLANNKPSQPDVIQDSIDRESARPDFQVLVFPGPMGVPANDIAHAPPAFITAGSLDKCCAAPSVALYEQMRKAGIPAELHMYANADHAFNLGEASNLLSIIHWPDRLADWLADEGFLDGSSRHLGVEDQPAR